MKGVRTLKVLSLFIVLFLQVGVLYVGPGQENDEKAIFSNQFGSIRYRWDTAYKLSSCTMVHILADFTMVDTHTANFCPAWEPWWIRQPLTQAGFSWEAWTPTKMASLPISGRMMQCRYNIVQIS